MLLDLVQIKETSQPQTDNTWPCFPT